MYTGTGDAFEIEVRREDGTIERLVRAVITPRAVTEGDIESWRSGQLERASSPRFRPSVERFLREVPVPSAMPAYSALHVDAEEKVWVRHSAPPGELASRWEVFDAGGRWQGGVDLPEGLEVSDIGADYVLGIYRDEVGIEFVHLPQIEKIGR